MKVDNNITISIKPRGNQRPMTDEEKAIQAKTQKEQKAAAQVQITKQNTVKISKNDPNDPTVSTKVLDSLDTGMINFSQGQRDALASVLMDKAKVAKSVNLERASHDQVG